MSIPKIGLAFDRSLPAPAVIEVAERLEAEGGDELWLIEDCFFTAGISLAAAALARTESLGVGLGILPAVARNPAITAMEIASLAQLGPGRVTAGIGHGIQEWMGQMGARTPSPLTTLREVITTVRQLLDGQEVTFQGREVSLDKVKLEVPPTPVPRVLAGVTGPKSVALAGEVANGLVVPAPVGPSYLRWATKQAGSPDDFYLATFASVLVADERREAYAVLAPFVASMIEEELKTISMLPFFDEMAERVESSGPEALIEMPPDYWAELGPIGTIDDAVTHIAALAEAGANSINLFPGPEVEFALEAASTVATIKAALH